MQKAGALAIARVPAIYVFPTVKDGIRDDPSEVSGGDQCDNEHCMDAEGAGDPQRLRDFFSFIPVNNYIFLKTAMI